MQFKDAIVLRNNLLDVTRKLIIFLVRKKINQMNPLVKISIVQ